MVYTGTAEMREVMGKLLKLRVLGPV